MNRGNGGGLVEYRCEAGESDRSDPEVDEEEDAWQRQERLRVTALVDKFRLYSSRQTASTRSNTRSRYSSLTVPSRWQSQSDRHAGLYSPDCNVTYNQPSSSHSHSHSPPATRSSAASSNDLDSLSAVYAQSQAQAQQDSRTGNRFQHTSTAFADDRSWSTELEQEDREVCSIVFGRHHWNHRSTLQSTHSNEELCGGDRSRLSDRHGDSGRYSDDQGDRPRYREFTDRLRNDDNYTDRSRLRDMSEDRLRRDDPFTDRSRGKDSFVDRSRSDDAFVDRSRGENPFVDRSRGDDSFVDRSRGEDTFMDRSRGEDPFVDRLRPSAFVDRSRHDETYRSRRDDIFRDRPRYEDFYSDRLGQEEIFDDRPRKDTDRWMEPHTDRTRHSLSFSVNKEFVLPERKRRLSPSPDPSKRTRVSDPPVPSPPPPPVLTQPAAPAFKPTDYSKPLPFKSSLFKPGNIDESINLLEKLKKKQKILSKCELKIGELYTKRNRLLSAPSSFYSLLQKPLKVQVNLSPVALVQNTALSFNGTVQKNQSPGSTTPSVKLHETLTGRLGLDRPDDDDDDCVMMEPVHRRMSDCPDRKSSPLAPPDKRQGSPDRIKAPVCTTASPERRKHSRLSPDWSRRSYSSTNSPEIIQTFKGDKDKASVNPILELAYGPRKNFDSVENNEHTAENHYQDQKYPSAWQEYSNTGAGWPKLRRSPVLQAMLPQPLSIPPLLPSTSYQETPPSLVPPPQLPGALCPPERHTVRSTKSQITLNLLPRVDVYSAFPSVPEDKAYVAKVEEFLSKIQKPKRPEKEVVVTLSDDDDEVIYVGESKRRSRERPALRRDSRRDRSPPHRASAQRYRGRLRGSRSPYKSCPKTRRLSPLNSSKPVVLAVPPRSAAVSNPAPEVPRPAPTSPSPVTADNMQSDMSSSAQQRPPTKTPLHKHQAPQKLLFTSKPGQTLQLIVEGKKGLFGKKVSGETRVSDNIIPVMIRETDSQKQEAKSPTTNQLSATVVASDLSESADTQTTRVISEDSSTVTGPCLVNEAACEKETLPTECTSKDTALPDKPENVICNTSVTLSDMDSIFCEGSAIATDVRDIQRRDDRLKKVVVNTQRNRTINKNLCLKNELLCLNIEKIGARIVVSSVEEQILNYLHCLASHSNDKLPNIIKKYFTPIKELSKKMDSVKKACRHCSELSSKSEPTDSGPDRVTREMLTDSQNDGTDSKQEKVRSKDKPSPATQSQSTNLTAKLEPTSVGSAGCTVSKLSHQEQHCDATASHCTQAAQPNYTPPEHQRNNQKSDFAESKQSHLDEHQKQRVSALDSQGRPLDKSVREKPLATTQLCKSVRNYDAATLHSAAKLEAGPKCDENSDSSSAVRFKSSENSDSSSTKTEAVRPKSSDSSTTKTEAVRPKSSENSDSSATKTEAVRPKSSENSDSSAAKTEDVSPKSSVNSDSSAAVRPKCRPPILAPEDRHGVSQVTPSPLPPRKEDNPINTVKQIQSSSDHIARIVSTIHQVDSKSTYYLKNNLLLKRLVVNGKSILKILIPEDRTDEIIDVVHTKFSCHGSAAAVMNILGKHFAPLPGLSQLVHNHILRCTFCNSKQ